MLLILVFGITTGEHRKMSFNMIRTASGYLRSMLLALLVIILAGTAAAYAADDMTVPVCYSEDEASASLREELKDRKELISLCLVTDTPASESQDIINGIFEGALEHTGDPEEGDYLRFQYEGCKASARAVTAGEDNAVLINYAVSYYDTAEQEDELDGLVAEIMDELDLDDLTDVEKVEAIYRYICSNVEYDYDNLTDDEYRLKHTAYAALAEGKAVCQGYSAALYRLLLEAGVDNRIVFGSSVSDTGDEQDHTWNIVRLGDLYYNTDITRDDELGTARYYLKGSGSFDEIHIRSDEYCTDDFTSAYEISENDYGSSGGFFKKIGEFFHDIAELIGSIFN